MQKLSRQATLWATLGLGTLVGLAGCHSQPPTITTVPKVSLANAKTTTLKVGGMT